MTKGVQAERDLIALGKDSLVEHASGTFRIVESLSFTQVVGINVDTGVSSILSIPDLKAVRQESQGMYVHHDLEDIGEENWKLANQRYAVIEPLLSGNSMVKGAVAKQAKEAGVDVATVYRWLQRYKDFGNIAALVPMRRGWKKGRSRISEEVEGLIDSAIDTGYALNRGVTITAAHVAVKNACEAVNLPVPNITTVRARIKKIPYKKILMKRGQLEEARKHESRSGELAADYPLQIVQIDHTPLDVFLVDDVFRESVGRAWVTLAICVYSRMIVGYHFSLEAPSALSVAMCIVNAVSRKERLLAEHNIDAEWPVWGKPVTIHSDNGSDFRTESLIKSCAMHGIGREFRPKDSPHWGGHIERLMGTFAVKAKSERGATFSNPAQRKGYDAEKEAIYTFDDYHTRLIRRIVMYNNTYHEVIKSSPIDRWRNAFFGTKKFCGLPASVADPLTFELDFMPACMRTIQNTGVEWDASYYCDAMRPWVGVLDEKTKKSKKFLFRRDPRDVRRIWFYEPSLKMYFEASINGYIENKLSVREYVKAKRRAKKEGKKNVDTALLERLAMQERQQEEEAAVSTKQARRNTQRAKNNSKAKGLAASGVVAVNTQIRPPATDFIGLVSVDEVEDFGEVDFGF